MYEPEGYDPGSEPCVPGTVMLGVGGSVTVPAGGGGEGTGNWGTGSSPEGPGPG